MSKTILLVDDHDANRVGFAAVFRRAGYQVMEATNGEEGVRAAREHHPDVILMDVGMPVMDGIEATRALKSDPATAEIPVVGLTGQALTRTWEELRDAGFTSYLTKPCDPARVRAEVARVSGAPAQS